MPPEIQCTAPLLREAIKTLRAKREFIHLRGTLFDVVRTALDPMQWHKLDRNAIHLLETGVLRDRISTTFDVICCRVAFLFGASCVVCGTVRSGVVSFNLNAKSKYMRVYESEPVIAGVEPLCMACEQTFGQWCRSIEAPNTLDDIAAVSIGWTAKRVKKEATWYKQVGYSYFRRQVRCQGSDLGNRILGWLEILMPERPQGVTLASLVKRLRVSEDEARKALYQLIMRGIVTFDYIGGSGLKTVWPAHLKRPRRQLGAGHQAILDVLKGVAVNSIAQVPQREISRQCGRPQGSIAAGLFELELRGYIKIRNDPKDNNTPKTYEIVS